MQFSVLHYHFRPGGVRRVIEQGIPALVRAAGGVTRVFMAAGEAPDADWRQVMETALFPCCVEWIVEPALGYWSEQQASAENVRNSIRETLPRLLTPGGILWAHNLSVGRNMLLSREVAAADTGSSLWLHHHDWWWDGRWERWPEMRAQGITSLEEAVALTLPCGDRIHHFCINATDTRRLRNWTGIEFHFLPNPAPPLAVDVAETKCARDFLRRVTGTEASWIYPCRALRRKNIAEALLVQRWLAPEAATVTTGLPSSAAERSFFETLRSTAARNHWPLHMAVCDLPGSPSVPSLMAASSAVAVTSLREGFGIVYQEAAALDRPLLARVPSGLDETLEAVGFHFRSAWRELLVPRHCCDDSRESSRVAAAKDRLKTLLPASLHSILESHSPPSQNVDFGCLTLQAQLEVLSTATAHASLPLNPALKHPLTPQPPSATPWLPAQWAEAILHHTQTPASAITPNAGWSRESVRFLTPLVQEWLEHPLLWESFPDER